MRKGKTKSGFSYQLDEKRLDDYELLETMLEVDGGNIAKVPVFVDGVLGEDQSARLKAHLKKKHGKIGINDMLAAVTEILSGDENGKKS